jgi:uncharacterized membrane protein (UPF0127 family)
MPKKILPLLVVLAAVLLAAPVLGQEFSEAGNLLTHLTIKGVPITAEVVSTPEKLYLGLSNRQGLAEGRGMLFLMSGPGLHAFCMRDMLFPIDIIWIADSKVAGIAPNLSPSLQGVVTSPVPVRLVLEVPGGFAERHDIKVGDPVNLQLSDLSLKIWRAKDNFCYKAWKFWAGVKRLPGKFLSCFLIPGNNLTGARQTGVIFYPVRISGLKSSILHQF